MHIYIYIPKLYTILLSRDLKTKTVDHHPPSTIHPKRTKIFGLVSEILIKYKRIKWTPSSVTDKAYNCIANKLKESTKQSSQKFHKAYISMKEINNQFIPLFITPNQTANP